jgi:hypothetical protein
MILSPFAPGYIPLSLTISNAYAPFPGPGPGPGTANGFAGDVYQFTVSGGAGSFIASQKLLEETAIFFGFFFKQASSFIEFEASADGLDTKVLVGLYPDPLPLKRFISETVDEAIAANLPVVIAGAVVLSVIAVAVYLWRRNRQ